MKYILTIHSIGEREIVYISQEEYERCKKSKESLLESLHIEEKMNVVIENYREFEMMLLDYTMRHAIYNEVSWSIFNEERNNINRRLANLLTACRLYLDHLVHHLNIIFGSASEHVMEVRKTITHEYDSELGYRIMEALRNYIQHKGFAITSLTHGSSWNEERTFMINNIQPFVSIRELESDKDFKRSVIKEMKAIGDTIDIRLYIRTYIASLGKIQEHVRNVIKKYSPTWEEHIGAMIYKYPDGSDKKKDPVGLVIAIMREDGTYGDVVYMFREHIQRWKRLEQLNMHIKYLQKQQVTTK